MNETEATPITGSVTLTMADNISILLVQFPTLIYRLAIFIAFLFGSAAVLLISIENRMSFPDDPAVAVSGAVETLWPFMAGSFALSLAIVTILNVVKWTRYPASNKSVIYTADDSGITTSDAAGASLHVPWSMLQRSTKTKHYVIMKTMAGGWRFAPLRAFSPGDAEKFWQLARAHTPAK
jgi:hypothetical protein